ncbi:septum formation initiator family protein [Rothia sp. LK2588]|uniref:septum formation initiator family protein n=1 Tax=Rothia sp. LK2588 TaxID=3114369 RepID=UPI0034CE2AB3
MKPRQTAAGSRTRRPARNRAGKFSEFFGARRSATPAPNGRAGRVRPAEQGDRKRPQQGNGPQPVAAHMFSGRFLLVAAVLAFIVIAAYAPLSSLLKQQAEMNQVRDNISRLQGENQQLQTELSWWQDDNYVKQQARDRLHYISEGETPYLVTGTDFTSGLADDTSAAAATAPKQSWTNNLWNSFQESSLDGRQKTQSQLNVNELNTDPSASANPTDPAASGAAGQTPAATPTSAP